MLRNRGRIMQRRLAAILAADVVGYSRLMEGDEIETLTSLKSHRRELIDRCIVEHRGRIVKTTGDGMLVEFASVVDAVACAVTIQRGMFRRNAGIPHAAGIKQFALLGISQGCAVSIAYAVRHPDRVSRLVLLGGFALGWKMRARTEEEKQAGEAMVTL